MSLNSSRSDYELSAIAWLKKRAQHAEYQSEFMVFSKILGWA